VADDSVAMLARQAPDAALLHFLPGEDRVDVLLVTARGRQAFRAALPRTQLDGRIAQLQEALRQARRDPRPVARELDAALIAPLQPALAAAGVKLLVLSLHDKLRFVPFAALHDGERWLAERYAIVVHPGARLQDLMRPTSPRWRVAAFGASAGGAGLPPLPAVPAEVRSVTAADSPSPRGQAWIDRAFDAQSLRGALAGPYQVLHIASHFSFAGGNPAESFLLLGDGGRLSLQQLGGSEYRFDRLELVALSACQTGLSQDDAYGQEVDGLGALLMAQGARAVLASLWQVNDESTGQLMSSLYRLRERDGAAPLPLALALQAAQVAMIHGAAGSDGTLVASRGAARRVDGEAAGAAFPGKSHPHHWAPFVLMGNWR
jgi:CHAT domain-containing protein